MPLGLQAAVSAYELVVQGGCWGGALPGEMQKCAVHCPMWRAVRRLAGRCLASPIAARAQGTRLSGTTGQASRPRIAVNLSLAGLAASLALTVLANHGHTVVQ